jgi:helix-turn-helix protein
VARLSKSEAAKRLGITRKTLYRHIRQGRITVEPDGMLDTTELLARGYTLDTFPVDQGDRMSRVDTSVYERLIEQLTSERDRLRHDLDTAQAEKAQLLEMIRTLSLPPARVERDDSGVVLRFRTWFWGRPR